MRICHPPLNSSQGRSQSLLLKSQAEEHRPDLGVEAVAAVQAKLLGHGRIALDLFFVLGAFMAHVGQLMLEAAALLLQAVEVLEYRKSLLE